MVLELQRRTCISTVDGVQQVFTSPHHPLPIHRLRPCYGPARPLVSLVSVTPLLVSACTRRSGRVGRGHNVAQVPCHSIFYITGNTCRLAARCSLDNGDHTSYTTWLDDVLAPPYQVVRSQNSPCRLPCFKPYVCPLHAFRSSGDLDFEFVLEPDRRLSYRATCNIRKPRVLIEKRRWF